MKTFLTIFAMAWIFWSQRNGIYTPDSSYDSLQACNHSISRTISGFEALREEASKAVPPMTFIVEGNTVIFTGKPVIVFNFTCFPSDFDPRKN